MERVEAERGPGNGVESAATQALRGSPECPACRVPIQAEWRACPECGADLGRHDPRPTPEQSASALPSGDTGEIAFVPAPGGAKRPITIVEVGHAPDAGPPISLASLATHTAEADNIPQEPLTEGAHKPVTIVRENEMEAPLELPEKSRSGGLEVATPATTLAPTVVVVSPETLSRRVLDRDDLLEIERMIGEAVERVVRQVVALQAPPKTAVLAAPTLAPRSARKSVAGVGAGLLAGGALAELLVLNWDIWVRGAVISSVGWLQQTGIIGMAALTGAGAAALLLGAARGGRRGARSR